MKFSKFLIHGAVPEWAEKYVNYKGLKKVLKRMAKAKAEVMKQSASVIRASEEHRPLSMSVESRHRANTTEEDVRSVGEESSEKDALSRHTRTQSVLSSWNEEVVVEVLPIQLEFEALMSKELEKVNEFYRNKETEMRQRFQTLQKQMQVLPKKQKSKEVTKAMFAKLESAVKEYYRGLGLLKNYVIMNYTAFHKIVKKHDKYIRVAAWRLSTTFLSWVEGAYFHQSTLLADLTHATEKMYIKFFAQGDRRKGMNGLRLHDVRHTDWDIFQLGLFVGILVCVFCYLLAVCTNYGVNLNDDTKLRAVFPVFRGIIFVVFYMWMWGFNVYAWTVSGINYRFIFEMDPKSYSDFHQIFRRAGFFSSILIFFLVWYFALYVNNLDFQLIKMEFLPLSLWVIFMVAMLMPFNIWNRAGRLYVLNTFARIAGAPFFTVLFKDFFIGDQLTSLVRVAYDFEYTLCYYATQSFLQNDAAYCRSFNSQVYPIISFFPYWWRFLQCFKRWWDSGRVQRLQLMNAGKYFSAMLVVLFDALSNPKLGGNLPQWRWIWVICAVISTAYSFMWDIKMDWGFLQPNSKFRFLRNKLAYSHIGVYYVAIVTNFLLRCSWVISISPEFFGIHFAPELVTLAVGLGEIYRRSQWNFFRLENEHLNNCGQYRAVDYIPLPFEGNTAKPESKFNYHMLWDRIVNLFSRCDACKRHKRRNLKPQQSADTHDLNGSDHHDGTNPENTNDIQLDLQDELALYDQDIPSVNGVNTESHSLTDNLQSVSSDSDDDPESMDVVGALPHLQPYSSSAPMRRSTFGQSPPQGTQLIPRFVRGLQLSRKESV
eukprot:GILK01003818.1.p1 GENE.GILK01003818.1~~GILK01003818.1.p1  ORF type:complete len:823 (+),score=116.33 GILK01003818.1:2051-4519(+)